MNLYLRLIRVVVAALAGARLGPFDPGAVSFRVWPLDLDANMHLNNGRYLALMDLGRVDLMLRSGLARGLWRRRWTPVLGAAQVRFRRPVPPFARVVLRTRLVGWEDRWVYLDQRIERADGTLAAHALLRAAFVGRDGTVPGDKVAALMGLNRSPPLPDAVHAWTRADSAMRELG
ncbi:MAG: acyl-CoA thioesterase [Azospirillaceae bacterium]